MFRGVQRLLAVMADWQPRDFLIGLAGVGVAALCAVVSLGFGTFAAYTRLSASEGPAFAAMVISAAYGLVAILVGVGLARWHARSSRDRPSAPPAPETLEALLQSLAAGGPSQDQAALIAAMRVGRDLSPMELLAISLVGGFVTGRKVRK